MTTRTLKLIVPDLWTEFQRIAFSLGQKIINHPQVVGRLPRHFRPLLKRFLPPTIVIAAVAITIASLGYYWIKSSSRARTQKPVDNRVAILGAKAITELNQEFTFPVLDSRGKKVTDLKFTVESAELRDEIVVKGKKATAIQGRMFLIINLRIASVFDKALNINTSDYFRLTANGNESDFLAPEIHNDPVLVAAISTKLTRIGFPINDTDSNLVLVVGEISGEKTKLSLNFP